MSWNLLAEASSFEVLTDFMINLSELISSHKSTKQHINEAKDQTLMENALATQEVKGTAHGLVVSESRGNEDIFTKMTGELYTGYLSLVARSGKLVDPPHNCQPGTFALVEGDRVTKFGDAITVALIDWRPLARIVDKRGKAVELTSFYNPDSDLFQEVCAKSEGKQPEDYVHYYGPEFLVYLDEVGKFATYFCNGKTSRRAAKETIRPLMGCVITLSSKLIPSSKYPSWYGPEAVDAGVPLNNRPDQAAYDRVLRWFQNPKDTVEQEGADPATVAAADDER